MVGCECIVFQNEVSPVCVEAVNVVDSEITIIFKHFLVYGVVAGISLSLVHLFHVFDCICGAWQFGRGAEAYPTVVSYGCLGFTAAFCRDEDDTVRRFRTID